MKKLIRMLLVISIVLAIFVIVFVKRDEIVAFLGNNSDTITEETAHIAEEVQETVLTETQEVIDGVFTEEVKADLWDSVKSFFATLWDAIVDFVKGKAESGE